jgi:hypothetical protein
MLHRTLALGQQVLLKMDTRFGIGYDSSLCRSGSPKQQEYQKHTLEPRETLTLLVISITLTFIKKYTQWTIYTRTSTIQHVGQISLNKW